IVRVVTRGQKGIPTVRFAPHDPFAIDVTVQAREPVRGLVVGVQVRDAHDRMLSGTRLDWQTSELPVLRPGEETTVSFGTPELRLGRGLYQLTVGCHEYPDSGHVFHWVDGAWRFVVHPSGRDAFVGPIDLGLVSIAPTPAQTLVARVG